MIADNEWTKMGDIPGRGEAIFAQFSRMRNFGALQNFSRVYNICFVFEGACIV